MDPLILALAAAGTAVALAVMAGIITTLLATPTACQCRDCTGWAWARAKMNARPTGPAAYRPVYTGLTRAVAR